MTNLVNLNVHQMVFDMTVKHVEKSIEKKTRNKFKKNKNYTMLKTKKHFYLILKPIELKTKFQYQNRELNIDREKMLKNTSNKKIKIIFQSKRKKSRLLEKNLMILEFLKYSEANSIEQFEEKDILIF